MNTNCCCQLKVDHRTLHWPSRSAMSDLQGSSTPNSRYWLCMWHGAEGCWSRTLTGCLPPDTVCSVTVGTMTVYLDWAQWERSELWHFKAYPSVHWPVVYLSTLLLKVKVNSYICDGTCLDDFRNPRVLTNLHSFGILIWFFNIP